MSTVKVGIGYIVPRFVTVSKRRLETVTKRQIPPHGVPRPHLACQTLAPSSIFRPVALPIGNTPAATSFHANVLSSALHGAAVMVSKQCPVAGALNTILSAQSQCQAVMRG